MCHGSHQHLVHSIQDYPCAREPTQNTGHRDTATERGMALLMVNSVMVVLGTLLFYVAWKAARTLWLKPRRIREVFEAQGIKCLPFSAPMGNLHEMAAMVAAARAQPMPQLSHRIVSRVFPHLVSWSRQHGNVFVHWFGPQARLTLTDAEQAKDILNNKFGHYVKSPPRPDTADLIGKGVLALEGEKWAQHRRIMNPAFFLEKLKAMALTMADCSTIMMQSWEVPVSQGKAINLHESFRTLTADIIAHTAFGSSYVEGKQVFEMQHEQQILADKVIRSIYIPGSRFMPTATNRYRWKLNKEIVRILSQMIQKRMKDGERDEGFGNDLLGLMMAANKGQLQGTQKSLIMGVQEIIDECKTFFFAGHETTLTLLTWTFMLLGSNLEWQERVREEVYALCGRTATPTAESVGQLKLVGMVLNEALRLYPPAVAMFRMASTDMQLGKILVPAGTVLVIPLVLWHHDPEYWGPDADEFRPDRFAAGVSNASRVPGAFMPFSLGPRSCIGQTFAMLEAKVVLSCILQHYRFRLSPEYKHAPITVLSLQPQFGMPVLLEKLD